MPQIHKARGRRADKKRKQEEEENATSRKRQRSDSVEIVVDGNQVHDDSTGRPPDIPFYGMLDEDDQEYFKRADFMLELDQFANAEERNLFLASVYKEAKGKELRIANSQSCSRLLERLICISTPSQLKALFQKFIGHFLNLCQHRFASHCCETLFIQSAPIVSKELTEPLEEQHGTAQEEVYVSMENLFLYALNEFQGNLGYLMTDPFASHTLRVLLLVFSGRPLGDASATSIVQSKKKEKITTAARSPDSLESQMNSRTVPRSFADALDKMISGMIAGLDANSLRALTTHPVANPILQLSLDIELSHSKMKAANGASPLLEKLVPADTQDSFAENDSFINSLAYDTVGSRLLEVIISRAPEKLVAKYYHSIFKARMGNFAKNDVAGFTVTKLLKRLNQTDLKDAVELLCPHIGLLVERSKTSLIRAMIESCRARNVETESIGKALRTAYGEDPLQRLIKMLKIDRGNMKNLSSASKDRLASRYTTGVHGSLLAQSMLSTPGVLRQLILDGLMAMDSDMLVHMAQDRAASRTLQSSLVASKWDIRYRRVVLQRFYGHITSLAVDTIASHVLDQFWTASAGLPFIREQIAAELFQHEVAVRNAFSGRVVWRNWNMDLYKTKRTAWISSARVRDGSQTSAIELARARYGNARKEALRLQG